MSNDSLRGMREAKCIADLLSRVTCYLRDVRHAVYHRNAGMMIRVQRCIFQTLEDGSHHRRDGMWDQHLPSDDRRFGLFTFSKYYRVSTCSCTWGKKTGADSVTAPEVLAVVLPLHTYTIDDLLARVAWVQRRNHQVISRTASGGNRVESLGMGVCSMMNIILQRHISIASSSTHLLGLRISASRGGLVNYFLYSM